MTEQVWLNLITTVGMFVLAWFKLKQMELQIAQGNKVSFKQALDNAEKLHQVHLDINGKVAELVAAKVAEALGVGEKKGVEDERTRAEERAHARPS